MSKAYTSKGQGNKKTRSSTSAGKSKGKSASKGVRINDRKELDHLNAMGSVTELQQAFSNKKKTKQMVPDVGAYLAVLVESRAEARFYKLSKTSVAKTQDLADSLAKTL